MVASPFGWGEKEADGGARPIRAEANHMITRKVCVVSRSIPDQVMSFYFYNLAWHHYYSSQTNLRRAFLFSVES